MFGEILMHEYLRIFKYIFTALLTVLNLLTFESIHCPSPDLPLCIAEGLIPLQALFPRVP